MLCVGKVSILETHAKTAAVSLSRSLLLVYIAHTQLLSMCAGLPKRGRGTPTTLA